MTAVAACINIRQRLGTYNHRISRK